jgi:hypothetical protein
MLAVSAGMILEVSPFINLELCMEAMLLPNEGLESNDIYKSTHHF